MEIAIVVVVSLILSSILNKLSSDKGWKKKAEEYVDDKAYMKILPVLFILIYLVVIIGLPMLGILMPTIVLIAIQIICITLAAFFFELFR